MAFERDFSANPEKVAGGLSGNPEKIPSPGFYA